MSEKIQSDDVVAAGKFEATPEQKHRHSIAYAKLSAAIILVATGSVLATCVLFSTSSGLDNFRQNAWTLLTVIVSSALGYLYGTRERD